MTSMQGLKQCFFVVLQKIQRFQARHISNAICRVMAAFRKIVFKIAFNTAVFSTVQEDHFILPFVVFQKD